MITTSFAQHSMLFSYILCIALPMTMVASMTETPTAHEEENVHKQYVSIDTVKAMCQVLHQQATQTPDAFVPDLIIGLSRGGLIPLGYLASESMFNNRNVTTIGLASYCDAGKRSALKLLCPFSQADIDYLQRFPNILIVDDLVDSGTTLVFVLTLLKQYAPDATIKTAVLFYKKSSSIKPDYYVEETTSWIVFPWESIK